MSRGPFLKTRTGRVSLLGMLVLDIFVIPVLLTSEAIPRRVGDLVFAVTMLVAMSATGAGKGRWAVLSVGLAAFGIQFFRFVDHTQFLVVLDAVLSAIAMGMFAGLVLFDVILAYLLVGATYAFVYEAVNELVPGSLTMEGLAVTPADYIYFSMTTMTSVGFGDALPRTPVTRAIAMAQALTGQLYVAVLIARFANPTRPWPGGTR